MDAILSIALASLQSDAVRLEQIGMNLTNAATPGYKRRIAVSTPFVSHLDNAIAQSSTAPLPNSNMLNDLRVGTLKATGQKLDVALMGSGYFEVMTAQGPAYTRQGNFHLDARGRLVTLQGDPVVGRDGEIILNSPQVQIDQLGNINAGGRSLAQLKIVQFETPQELRNLGQGLVITTSTVTALPDSEIQIRQGYLENANVNTAHEMVQMTLAMRHAEAMQKFVQNYDETMGLAIRKLGENP